MKTLRRAIVIVGLSIAYWLIAGWALLNALFGPCGRGPDAMCSGGGATEFAITAIIAIVAYIALLVLLIRRSKRP